MIITRKEFDRLIETAVLGADKCLGQESQTDMLALLFKIEADIKKTDLLNGGEPAKRIAIQVCAN